MPFFPDSYSHRFDEPANILVSLFGNRSADQRRKENAYIDTILVDALGQLPAIYPIIAPHDKA
jgi:hypothetical protein